MAFQKPQINTIKPDIKNLSIYLRSTKKFGKTTSISLQGNDFTYNENKVAVINDNIIISSREPTSDDTGSIWFKYT